jgi:hypothetical protein
MALSWLFVQFVELSFCPACPVAQPMAVLRMPRPEAKARRPARFVWFRGIRDIYTRCLDVEYGGRFFAARHFKLFVYALHLRVVIANKGT